MSKIQKCLYCDNVTNDPHFASSCCGRGMCDECFDNLQGTEEQWQVNFMDDEDYDKVKEEYQDADYLCFECVEKWGVK